MAYKKGSAWKRVNWDRWTFSRKALHVLTVIVCGLLVLAMVCATAYFVLVVFGLYGYITHFRDEVLLEIMKYLFD